MHTSWSHDCLVEPEELVEHALAEGLGAIAVTDHNAFGGAEATVEAALGTDLLVIPGEEVKTDNQGEVIGLFLEREIPRGMPFADTIAAIKAQGGLVYLPHPFDRMHSIPDAKTIHRHLSDIDVFEVYNARLLFEQYNDEALRFARKYNLTMGAGSDAHVLQGVGTGGAAHARVRRPRRVPGQPAHRGSPPPPALARVPPGPQVDRPGQGKGPWRAEPDSCRLCLPPTRSTSATSRRRSPRRTSSVTRSDGPAKDGFRRSDRGIRSPTSSSSSSGRSTRRSRRASRSSDVPGRRS